MLSSQLNTLVLKQLETKQTNELQLFELEKEYLEQNRLLPEGVSINIEKPETRFINAYIERSDKESEEVLAVEDATFLNQPIHHFKTHMNEFLYLESDWFNLISVDAVSLEVDDVFRTFDVMLGIKLQKKYHSQMKNYLLKEFEGDETKFDLMFSGDEGIWSLNFDLDFIKGFSEDMTIGQAYQLIYHFLFQLMDSVEGL